MSTAGRFRWLAAAAVVMTLGLAGCGGDSGANSGEGDGGEDDSTFTDSRDKRTYKKVTIGTQTWMAENLDYNADSSNCYENNADSCSKYGRLYDWATAMGGASSSSSSPSGVQGVCPVGWHLPSAAEWTTLANYVGSSTAGTKLKSKTGWYDDGNGTDEYGFSALPGGGRNIEGSFESAGKIGIWWSATVYVGGTANYRSMSHSTEYVMWNTLSITNMFSVRCVKN